MGAVKRTRRVRLTKSLYDKLALDHIQFGLIADIETVAQNLEIGRVAVDLVAHSAAETPIRRSARLRM